MFDYVKKSIYGTNPNVDNKSNVNIVSKDGSQLQMQFEGELQGRIAKVLLASHDNPHQYMLEAAVTQNFEIIDKVGTQILTKLRENQETNEDLISQVTQRLSSIKELKETSKDELKQRAIKAILEIKDPKQLEIAIKDFLSYGGMLWEIPKFVLEKSDVKGGVNLKSSPSEFRTTFDKTCDIVRIGRKLLAERELSTVQGGYHVFRKAVGQDTETWTLHYLQQILIEKGNAYIGFTKPLYFNDPLLFEFACSWGFSSLANLYLEYNGSPPLTSEIILKFSKSISNDYQIENVNKIWELMENNVDFSTWSLVERKLFFDNLCDFRRTLISTERLESILLKLVKITPELRTNVCLEQACDKDLPKLLEFLMFDSKSFTFDEEIEVKDLEYTLDVNSYIINYDSTNCIQMLVQKGEHISSLLVKSILQLYNKNSANSYCSNLDTVLQRYPDMPLDYYGSSSKEIRSIITSIIKSENANQRVVNLNWVLSLIKEVAISHLKDDEIKKNLPLFESLLAYHNHIERKKYSDLFISLFRKETSVELFKNWSEIRDYLYSLIKNEKNKVLLIPGLLLVPFVSNSEPSKDPLFVSYLKRKSDMLDGKGLKSFCQFLFALKDTPKSISSQLIQLALKPDAKKDRLKYFQLIKSLCDLDLNKEFKVTTTIDDCFSLLKNQLFKITPVDNIDNFESIYNETIAKFRNPIALYIYQANLSKNLNQQIYKSVAPLIGEFVTGILKGTYPKIRYENSKHLDKVFENRPELFEEWKKGDQKKAKDLFKDAMINVNSISSKHRIDPEWTVVDTDKDQDMLLMGEVQGSCQSINFDAEYSKCLINFIMDGKIRIIAVKDVEGNIIGRCVFRIMWDELNNTPVLFREKLYVNNNNKYVKKLIKAECMQRAQKLNLPLVTGIKPNKEKKPILYPAIISSLSMRSVEYVDALAGGIHHPYDIEKASVLYQPKGT
jgi:hypothetical protein